MYYVIHSILYIDESGIYIFLISKKVTVVCLLLILNSDQRNGCVGFITMGIFYIKTKRLPVNIIN